MGGLFSVGGQAIRTAGTWLGGSAARAGAAGAAGGLLLDDVPVVRRLDPTSNDTNEVPVMEVALVVLGAVLAYKLLEGSNA